MTDPEPYELAPTRAVEPKVLAATSASGASAVVAGFLLWLLDEWLWGGPEVPPEVPMPVALFVALVVTTAGTFAAGYWARHVNRRGG